MVACASNSWAANVNQIESLTSEINSYKEKEKMLQGGLFADEGSRIGSLSGEKRKNQEPEEAHDIWGEFESMIMKGGGNRGIDVSQEQGTRVNISSIR